MISPSSLFDGANNIIKPGNPIPLIGNLLRLFDAPRTGHPPNGSSAHTAANRDAKPEQSLAFSETD